MEVSKRPILPCCNRFEFLSISPGRSAMFEIKSTLFCVVL